MSSEALTNPDSQLMDAQQAELYERLQAFSLDQPDAQLSFSKRLARENSWSLGYAQQAIEEYKRFTFLAITAGHPVTPSDQVDQVWHLHLTYTRSYWEDFCPNILQRHLHHDPTLGGQTENQKFSEWYHQTLESYEAWFGQKPPTSYWPPAEERFGRDSNFVRTNIQQNWVLPKVQTHKVALACAGVLLAVAISIYSAMNIERGNHPLMAVLLTVIWTAAGFGTVKTLIGLMDFLKNPSWPRPSLKDGSIGCGGAACGYTYGDFGGCGGGGCGSG
ncbi:MAG: hypothetical protein AAGF01_18985 [Cyanobacteria bacterium P01_G01_bin.38]